MSATNPEMKMQANALLQSMIGDHILATAIVLASLIVIIIILLYAVYYYRSKAMNKSNFGQLSRYPNPGMNPQWNLGSEDAGYGGPMDRASTLLPPVFNRNSGMPTTGQCPPGQSAMSFNSPDGGIVTQCGMKSGGMMKNSAAEDERQALMAVGGMNPEYGPSMN